MAGKVRKIPKKGKLAWDNIYVGDSLEGMKRLPDNSIDLVMTSPPYADMKKYADGLEGFSSFHLKAVLKGTNSVYPPRLKDLRGIALAL